MGSLAVRHHVVLTLFSVWCWRQRADSHGPFRIAIDGQYGHNSSTDVEVDVSILLQMILWDVKSWSWSNCWPCRPS
jgi:hypothetical protein